MMNKIENMQTLLHQKITDNQDQIKHANYVSDIASYENKVYNSAISQLLQYQALMKTKNLKFTYFIENYMLIFNHLSQFSLAPNLILNCLFNEVYADFPTFYHTFINFILKKYEFDNVDVDMFNLTKYSNLHTLNLHDLNNHQTIICYFENNEIYFSTLSFKIFNETEFNIKSLSVYCKNHAIFSFNLLDINNLTNTKFILNGYTYSIKNDNDLFKYQQDIYFATYHSFKNDKASLFLMQYLIPMLKTIDTKNEAFYNHITILYDRYCFKYDKKLQVLDTKTIFSIYFNLHLLSAMFINLINDYQKQILKYENDETKIQAFIKTKLQKDYFSQYNLIYEPISFKHEIKNIDIFKTKIL